MTTKDLSDIRLRAAQCLYETWVELGEIQSQPLLRNDIALGVIVAYMRFHCATEFRSITGRQITGVQTIFELSTDAEVREGVPVVFGKEK